MDDKTPLCDVKLNRVGSIEFKDLRGLPGNCRLPSSIKSIRIPLEQTSFDYTTQTTPSDTKTPNTGLDKNDELSKGEPAMDSREASATIELPKSDTHENTVATVGVDQAINQVKSLVPAGHDASPALMIGGAAVLAIVGAAIKFGPSMLKARAEKAEREHETRMKQLELEEKKAEQKDDQHQQCNASRLALELKLNDLSAKVDILNSRHKETESAKLSLSNDDVEELNERLEKLEKKLKIKNKPVKK